MHPIQTERARAAVATTQAAVPAAHPSRRREIWLHFLLYPSHTLPTALAPVLVAAGLAVRDGVFAPGPLLLVFVGSWAIHVAGVFADNHELLRRHAAVPEHPELLRALADGTLTLRGLRQAILACLVVAVLAGAWPVLLGGVPALVLGILGVAASLGYAAGPRPYARHGLADPIFLAMFGVFAVAGSYYVQAAAVRGANWTELPALAWLAGLPAGCLVTAVLVIDDIRDRTFDAHKGWRTTPVRFGLAGSRAEWVALVVVAYLLHTWLALAAGQGALALLPWSTAPFAFAIGRAVCRHDTTRDLLRMTPRTALLAMAFAAAQALAMVLAR